MYTDTVKMAELPELVGAYASSDFNPDQMRPLMDLIQRQTDYIQKRFWKMVDERKAEAGVDPNGCRYFLND
jgi:hypothetical protein